MTVIAPSRPPGPDELEALIEEARRRQRRRRGTIAVILMLVAAALFVVLGGSGKSHSPRSRGNQAASSAGKTGSIPDPPPSNAIVFAKATNDGLDARIEIAYVPASGGAVVSLTKAAKHGMAAAEPRWSPDGSRIAFVKGQGQALAIIKADGSDQHVIAAGRGYYESPTWSPNGRTIAYVSGPNWSVHAIFTIRPNGTDERKLTAQSGSLGNPAWSPDGARIAYVSKYRLWIMHANGTDEHPITTCGLPRPHTRPGPSVACLSDSSPTWSPAGNDLVFLREQDHRLARRRAFNSSRLYVLKLSTNKVRPLTPKIRWAESPDWRSVASKQS